MNVFEISQGIFKRDSKGNIRVWYYETGTDGVNWGWRSKSGIFNGKITTSEWTMVEQKNIGRSNETSLEIQASNEAHAEYNKKLDRGYFQSIEDIDKFDKISPMLASKYEDHSFDFESNRYYSQPKLDGIRCIARSNGLWTRAGKEIVAVPHIMESLQDFFQKYPEAVLDGELYNHELKDNFNKITSMVRKTKPTTSAIEEASKIVQYHVYDMVRCPDTMEDEYGPKPFFGDRFSWLKDELNLVKKEIQVVKTCVLDGVETMDQKYGEYLESGYEGQMIRIDGEYQEKKRSKFLIKRKEFITDEFKVVSVEEGKGNWSGYIKRFILQLPNGTEFGSGVRGNQDVLRELFENEKKPEWATVRYFTPTPDGIPRFPVVVDWGFGERTD